MEKHSLVSLLMLVVKFPGALAPKALLTQIFIVTPQMS
jgi:hypothetical protein